MFMISGRSISSLPSKAHHSVMWTEDYLKKKRTVFIILRLKQCLVQSLYGQVQVAVFVSFEDVVEWSVVLICFTFQ